MDYKYWNEYYKQSKAPTEASEFAKYTSKYMTENKSIMELGCGNGRDSIFLASKGLKVTAIDQAESAVNKLNNEFKSKDIKFVCDNFINNKIINSEKFDYIYSRFTLHSISEEDEQQLFKNVYKALNSEGVFFIEARSTKDEIFGLGEKVDKNTYKYNNHTRRFLELGEVISKLKMHGFDIKYGKESDGWAIFEDKDPVVIRLIATK